MSSNISTLAQLLDAANTQWRVFDIGRRLSKIDKETFAAIESTTTPYPFPLNQHALMAIQFWDKAASAEPYVWFLKFPLDEQSKLIAATRDHFANMVLEAIGTQLTGEQAQQGQLDNNPYVFTPNANKRAAFNARLKVELKQPASAYYEHAQLYLSGKLGFDQWQSVALQGLADYAARLQSDNNSSQLLTAWPQLPAQVRQPLSAQLENTQVPLNLTELLVDSALKAVHAQDQVALIDNLRAMSDSQAQGLVQQCVEQLMSEHSQCFDEALCQVVAGRLWRTLESKDNLGRFMELCSAVQSEQPLFESVFADLVAIPSLRPQVLALLRSSDRSEQLSRAIGRLFS